MITVICSVTDEKIFKERLEASLKNQTAKYNLRLTNPKLSLAESYNTVENINTEYLAFVHQDLTFLEEGKFLEKVENLANSLPQLGIAGLAGWKEGGTFVGYFICYVERPFRSWKNRKFNYFGNILEGRLFGRPFKKAEEVQVVDDLFLLLKKETWEKCKFDERFPFHGLGLDYSLQIKYNLRLKNYVLPLKFYDYSGKSYTSEYLAKHGKPEKVLRNVLYPKWKGKIKRIRGRKL